MNNPGLFQARWNLRRLVLCNFVPLALLAFWLWPTGQMLCVLFDEWLFRRLNAPLASHPIWLHVWAIASVRPFEAVVAGRLDRRRFPESNGTGVWAVGETAGSFTDECGA